MATLATQTITRAGLAATLAAANAGGDKFTPTDRTYLEVNNGSGGAITVTIETPATAQGEPITDRAVSVAAGARVRIGPFPGGIFADPADSGLCDITYSGVTSLTIAAIELP